VAAIEVLHALDHPVAEADLPHLVQTIEQEQDLAGGELPLEKDGEPWLQVAILEVAG